MPTHSEQQFSPYSAEQLFVLVADVQRYPEFIPWCRAARVLQRDGNWIIAELVIHFKGFTEQYTSRVTLSPPVGGHLPGRIDVELVSGPFEHLRNHWIFTPRESGGATIDFFLDFRFRSRILDKLVSGLFLKANAKMVQAFRTRADALYGQGQI